MVLNCLRLYFVCLYYTINMFMHQTLLQWFYHFIRKSQTAYLFLYQLGTASASKATSCAWKHLFQSNNWLPLGLNFVNKPKPKSLVGWWDTQWSLLNRGTRVLRKPHWSHEQGLNINKGCLPESVFMYYSSSHSTVYCNICGWWL